MKETEKERRRNRVSKRFVNNKQTNRPQDNVKQVLYYRQEQKNVERKKVVHYNIFHYQ